ncbi:MAG: hypothetical protein JSS87_09770 [Acidobacteria bacterium]|nr:hypothetical protein [Acidobacteriota bacterium]
MEPICQRCGADLTSSDASFCASCGLPQLRVSEDAIAHADGAASGVHAANRHAAKAHGVLRADWRFALRCAFGVAAPAGVLLIFSAKSEAATLFLVLWILTSSLLAIVLYHRGRPALPLSFRLGARIGMVTGTVIAAMLFGIFATSAFILRFHSHSPTMDNEYRERIAQVAAQQKLPPEVEAKLASPEVKAGITVTGCVFYGLILIGMSAITGAAGGAMLRTGRFTPR